MSSGRLVSVVKRAEAYLATEHHEPPEGVPWDWYAESCPY